ncbi:hypothetical protein Dsin_006943 [Dipteronia sinensis]|uniref:EF-hand domain-containing protein n=1 Tax=Dipteronia sinensis TaxID=43782 RepID=A0AAE0AZ92_9ROSI|nr:hypothetical protein Dsin_006943 [Dipteronia sinensis]
MGNTCVGPNLGGNGFLQFVTAVVWRTRPPEDGSLPPPPPPTDSNNFGAPNPIQSTPPPPVKINNNDASEQPPPTSSQQQDENNNNRASEDSMMLLSNMKIKDSFYLQHCSFCTHADGSGQITLEELKKGLERAGANIKESEITGLIYNASESVILCVGGS